MVHATETETSDAFLDIVLADSELLAAEFEAIVSGAWPPRPRRPRPAFPHLPQARSGPVDRSLVTSSGRPEPSTRTPRCRQRGPP